MNGVRVLERVRRVGVEEPAAVGAELLDRLLAGDRAAGDLPACVPVEPCATVASKPCEVLDRRPGHRARPRTRTRAAAGSAASCGRGRPRSCRSCAGPARARPRISATITAMPAAADTKFCTVRPTIWVRWLIVDSPRVALPVRVGHEADRGVERQRRRRRSTMSVGLNGSAPWSRWSTYSSRNDDDAERQQRQRVDVPALLALADRSGRAR